MFSSFGHISRYLSSTKSTRFVGSSTILAITRLPVYYTFGKVAISMDATIDATRFKFQPRRTSLFVGTPTIYSWGTDSHQGRLVSGDCETASSLKKKKKKTATRK
jgi:hypothetical protein